MKYKKGDLVRIADTKEAVIYHREVRQSVPVIWTEGVVDDPGVTGAWVIWRGEHGCERDRTWVPYIILEPVKGGEKEKIVVYREGQKVIAKDLSTGKVAEAKCRPEDEFDFHFGATLAFARVTGAHVELDAPEPPKLYNGKVVCVEKGPGFFGCDADWWTAGRVYMVKDGVIRDDDGTPRDPIHSIEELNKETEYYARFIALVE